MKTRRQEQRRKTFQKRYNQGWDDLEFLNALGHAVFKTSKVSSKAGRDGGRRDENEGDLEASRNVSDESYTGDMSGLAPPVQPRLPTKLISNKRNKKKGKYNAGKCPVCLKGFQLARNPPLQIQCKTCLVADYDEENFVCNKCLSSSLERQIEDAAVVIINSSPAPPVIVSTSPATLSATLEESPATSNQVDDPTPEEPPAPAPFQTAASCSQVPVTSSDSGRSY